MKALFFTIVLVFAFKSFAAEVGEDQKAPCPYSNQSSSRQAKIVDDSQAEQTKEVKTAVAK